MTIAYPLEIENIGEDTYILISRGHHDPHEFVAAVRAADYEWPLGMPQHMWMKTLPAPKGSAYRAWYSPVDEGTRGAWPCTYVREAFGAERYEALMSSTTGGASP